ncbi:MAG: lysylphosphatidylglycerol synthase domain-containing protein [Gemmatimonadaceae bacterium]|nr:lysylphosphatidylglycerol synthase domain-containing protein [Gemmatimonadaceae bacterium]
MLNARRSAFVAAQWILAAATVWYAVKALRGQWAGAGARLGALRPEWGWIALATVIVVATYVLLIETWRRILIASGETLPFGQAARIWFVSNLGKYVPGKVWSIAAMTMMARDSKVSGVAAAGSSVLIQLVTVAAGIGVVLVTGAQAVDHPGIAVAAAGGILAVLAATPALLPHAGRLVSSLTGRSIALPRTPASVVWLTTASSIVSWIMYGVAFQFFVRGILGSAAGATSSYIAVYAASYIIGFLALFAPGGAVVRESAMVTGMLRLGLTGQADALAVAIASRLWLTVTELLPGFAYMAAKKRASRTD